ncbi:amidohydrolase family protein [Rhizorhapis suberifaciens]|uniref:Imidazolonepropionase-like amidohydrolase n=1 Tax=Rhizorhapis suberifaciens TaxID=13656 RepID=A0A840HV48_9SPHN|nr:amidohydrolase family protein [Rhizorhapis suberifaciens]MBB4641449.1 imidazolonepropionase-like amidohydrolase [Rhizorhapis suberifaciens]
MAVTTAFINAHIFDGKGSSQAGQTLLVENGRIAGIGSGDAPSHAEVIDLDGRTVMPGMTVGHWHGEFVDIGPPLFSAGRGGVFLGTEEPPAVLALCAASSLQTALMSGVTRIVSGSCSNDLDWQMKVAIQRGLFEGPHLTPCSRHVVTTGDYEDRGHWWKNDDDKKYDGVRRIGGNVFADGPEQISKAVRQEILRGAEVIKVLPTGGHGFALLPGYRGLSIPELEAVVRTAHERGARVRAHVASASAILECLEIGVDIIDHADEMDDACIESMVKHGATLVPSMLFSKLLSYGGVGEPKPGGQMDEAWDNMKVMLARANAAGVNIVPGDDFGAQGMAHALGVYARELLVYTDDMGIPPADT